MDNKNKVLQLENIGKLFSNIGQPSLIQRENHQMFLFNGWVVRVVKSSIRLVFITRLDLMNGDKLASTLHNITQPTWHIRHITLNLYTTSKIRTWNFRLLEFGWHIAFLDKQMDKFGSNHIPLKKFVWIKTPRTL